MKSGRAADVSVIVCVKNGANIIVDCIQSIQKNQPKEIIVVDGNSSDETHHLARQLGAVVLSDEGKGLPYARQLGVKSATGKQILFVGPDNILPQEFIERFVTLKEEWGFHAASVQTRVSEPKTFWDRGLDFRWLCLCAKPGPVSVVGTPSLYDSELFVYEPFAPDSHTCDDTDLGERLVKRGYKLGIVPLLAYDQNGYSFRTVWKKFSWYGQGDACFYRKYRPLWTAGRRLQSLTHPFRQTVRYSKLALGQKKVGVVIWLFVAMSARYCGWYSHARKLVSAR